MRAKLFIFAFLLSSACIISTAGFAQTAPGENSECPTSYSFKRNNGNGGGVCNGDAQVRVRFSQMPSPENIPLLTAIYYKGQPSTKVTMPVAGELISKDQSYISYCLVGSLPKTNGNPVGYISSTVKIVLEFTYRDGTICRTDVVN